MQNFMENIYLLTILYENPYKYELYMKIYQNKHQTNPMDDLWMTYDDL